MFDPSLPPVSGDPPGTPTASDRPAPHALTTPAMPTQGEADLGTIDGHQVLGLLGRGGMGVVYKVLRNGRPGEVCALKLLKDVLPGYEEISSARQDNELFALARLSDHPNFVRIVAVGRHERRPYFLMEYVEGGTLLSRLNGRPWPTSDALRLMATVARAVHFAHERGIIHRDLKPANILLRTKSEIRDPKAEQEDRAEKPAEGSGTGLPSDIGSRISDCVPLVSDLGLARQVEQPGLTQTGAIVGTAEYMAPEQAAGQVRQLDHRADVYSLGVILFELLTGHTPFRGRTPLDTIKLIASKPGLQVPPVLAAQPELCAICVQCLDPEPGRRYQTALALAEDVERALGPDPRQAVQARISPLWRLRNWIRLNPWARPAALVAGVLLLLVASGVGSFVLTRERYIHDLEQETQRANAERERAERRLIAQRLQQVLALHTHEPARALELLRDERACPARLRDFTWHWLEEACLVAHWQQDLGGFFASLTLAPGGELLAGRDRDDAVHLWRVDRAARQVRPLNSYGKAGCLAFAPDGKALALGLQDGKIRVEEPGTGKVLRTCRHPSRRSIVALAVGPQGELAAADDAGRICVTQADRVKDTLDGPAGIRTLAFLADGKALVAGTGQDPQRRGQVVWWDLAGPTKYTLDARWNANGMNLVPHPSSSVITFSTIEGEVVGMDLPTGREQFRYRGSPRGVGAVAFSADGRRLALGNVDDAAGDGRLGGTLSLASLDPPGPARQLQALERNVLTLAFAGEALLAAADRSLACLGLRSTLESHALTEHTDRVQAVAVSLDGELLLTGGDDNLARLWRLDGARAERLRLLGGHQDSVFRVAIAPDGRSLATADLSGKVHVWPVAGDAPSATLAHPQGVMGLAWSGKYLVTVCEDALRLWDPTTGREVARGKTEVGVFGMAATRDGARLAVGGGQGDSATGLVELWRIDAKKGILEKEQSLRGHDSEITCLAFDADGATLASGESKPGVVRLWRVSTGESQTTLAHPRGGATALAFAPDGQTLLTASAWDTEVPGILTFWDRVTAEERLSFTAHRAAITALVFDPRGRLFITASNDHTVALWAASARAPGTGGNR